MLLLYRRSYRTMDRAIVERAAEELPAATACSFIPGAFAR